MKNTIYRFAAVLAFVVPCLHVEAHPYASGVTNNNGNIEFILNEGGGDVNVVFEDNSTNAMGVLDKGQHSFPLGTHTSYSIIVTKLGNGVPALISSDSDQFSIWNSPRGIDVNKNAKIGYLFGRTYVGNSAVGGTAPNNKGHGLYALNADLTDSPLGHGANAWASATWANSGANGPWRLRIAPDNTVFVSDFSTGGILWQFAPDLNSSNQVLTGCQDFFGTPVTTGSIETGDLVVWTTDGGKPAPATAVLGPNTFGGSYNCLFRYDIGSGPLPWTQPPNYAYTLGLDSIAGLRVEMDLGADGKIIGGFGRANLSNGNIQILDPTGSTLLYNSLHDGTDRFNGISANGAQVGTYCGVRVSPDGRYIASVDINNGITIATMIDGIPDETSIFGIPNTPAVGNSRGMCWDAADNLYVVSSGQGLLRVYSLGITTTCITSNDFTGTNGSFQVVLPTVAASVNPTVPVASQNYINNTSNPGVPIPGVFTIALTTNHLDGPVVVNYKLSGSAVYGVNYTINTDNTLNGVIVTTNTVTFPAGNFPGGGNWSQDIKIIPTATPVTGPTFTVTLRLSGGATYTAVSPIVGNVSIANTGPQLLLLSAATAAQGTTMNRGISGDYASFIITRLGDLNGPGNSAGNVNPTPYTITNFTLSGTAVFPTDYTAGPQNRTDPGTEVPVDGTPGIVISPGTVVFTNVIGNPVAHTDLTAPPTNVTVIVRLGSGAATNLTSLEGLAYSVSNNAVTLTELDNTVGPEIVLWSNPLTNAADSVNWTLTFASTNLGTTTKPPVVIPNYANVRPDPADNGGTNNFDVTFGYPIANDGIEPSPVMLANGWGNVLKMTVNKDFAFPAPSGVNVYPQGHTFSGNYALRFQMYLSIWSDAIDNSNPGSTPNEFALFGLNHRGTNCNWKPTTPVTAATGGSGMTNSDGVWIAVNAGAGSITPADYDAFAGNPIPNAGPVEPVSNTALSQAGVFKHPPFVAQGTSAGRLGGSPINKWVDVSLEVTQGTNVSLYIDRSKVLASYNITNGGNYTNGTIMLGYLDPVTELGDAGSQFVYYSNVRVVALPESPSNLIVSPVNQTNLWGSTASFTVSASGTAPLTYQWKKNGANLTDGGNISGATTATLTIANVTGSDADTYTVGVTNVAGGAVSGSGILNVVIPPPTFSPSGVSLSGTDVHLSFSSVNPYDTINAFKLLSSPVVQGPYTNTSAVFTSPGDGTFQVTTPQGGSNMFYRLIHN